MAPIILLLIWIVGGAFTYALHLGLMEQFYMHRAGGDTEVGMSLMLAMSGPVGLVWILAVILSLGERPKLRWREMSVEEAKQLRQRAIDERMKDSR